MLAIGSFIEEAVYLRFYSRVLLLWGPHFESYYLRLIMIDILGQVGVRSNMP
jgi:hypothetical protein